MSARWEIYTARFRRCQKVGKTGKGKQRSVEAEGTGGVAEGPQALQEAKAGETRAGGRRSIRTRHSYGGAPHPRGHRKAKRALKRRLKINREKARMKQASCQAAEQARTGVRELEDSASPFTTVRG